jgi:hypothetical protein
MVQQLPLNHLRSFRADIHLAVGVQQDQVVGKPTLAAQRVLTTGDTLPLALTIHLVLTTVLFTSTYPLVANVVSWDNSTMD